MAAVRVPSSRSGEMRARALPIIAVVVGAGTYYELFEYGTVARIHSGTHVTASR